MDKFTYEDLSQVLENGTKVDPNLAIGEFQTAMDDLIESWDIEIADLVKFIYEGSQACSPLAPMFPTEFATTMLLGFQMGFETCQAIQDRKNSLA